MYHTTNLRKPTHILALIGCLVLAGLLLFFPKTAATGVKSGLLICMNTVIPSLSPFLFLIDYLFSIICILPRKKGYLPIIFAVLFGLIGGFPMGAKALARLHDDGVISKQTASALLCGCVNAGPAFLLSAVGVTMFHSPAAGLFLFISLSTTSLLCIGAALLFLPKSTVKKHPEIIKSEPVQPDFGKSMQSSLHATLTLCSYIIFFSCITAYCNLLIETAELPLFLIWLCSALVEVTGGCVNAAAIGSLAGLLMAGIGISFCGISVIMQVRQIAGSSGISLRYFYYSRPIHAGINILLLLLITELFPDIALVFAIATPVAIYSMSPVFSFFFLSLAIIFVLCDKKFRQPENRQY